MLPEPYAQFYGLLNTDIAQSRLVCDPLGTLAYGTDASFYRLIPKMVIRTETEAEVARILTTAHRLNIPVTFRAAGTSLSGQALSDSVLVIAGDSWTDCRILEEGKKIRLQPGVIGAQANRCLAAYGRKIGPDPASINAAMIGGIAANNASGMCCGTAQNSYQTVSSMRIIFSDGALLDTADRRSREQFRHSHGRLLQRLSDLSRSVRADSRLSGRIRQKFRIKNTTGYSLNALVDFEDPFDIITHLMIGSEGTLGFISEITYNTVVEEPCKASSLMIFPRIETACKAAAMLKSLPTAAAEIMDRAALRSVENKSGMPAYLKALPDKTTALLVETRANQPHRLEDHVARIKTTLAGLNLERPIEFTAEAVETARLWDIRKGLFPSVGAVRRTGTTVIIEDVAFPLPSLANATLDLQALMADFNYSEAIIFGHALEGNLHFVFTQDFSPADEVDRYRRFMDQVCEMVVGRYDGSLKAEHGTGRNMAPYVELEWGPEAYGLMKRIKEIFDPGGLLNPGVILNNNPEVHVQNLKPMPATHAIVDKCTECGFCEAICPSKNLTLTPRQRIVAQREISRLRSAKDDPRRLDAFRQAYAYAGEETCAADGLCALSCPVDIDTGALTKSLRELGVQSPHTQKHADWVAAHFQAVNRAADSGLRLAHCAHRVLGSTAMAGLAARAREISGLRLPLWNRYMPRGVNPPAAAAQDKAQTDGVVYFPSCINRSMGPAKGDPDAEPLTGVVMRLLEKAGFTVVLPPEVNHLCCGMAFESKGFTRQADQKSRELERALAKASNDGKYPILCDTSPCLYRMRRVMGQHLKLLEPGEFAFDYLLNRLRITPVEETVAVHTTCSSLKMGVGDKLRAVAEACARKVVVPEQVNCCGFAGDRGFTHPELNASALENLRPAVADNCLSGYSNSRTCEIGLSLHSGIYYKSILYLLDRCARRQ